MSSTFSNIISMMIFILKLTLNNDFECLVLQEETLKWVRMSFKINTWKRSINFLSFALVTRPFIEANIIIMLVFLSNFLLFNVQFCYCLWGDNFSKTKSIKAFKSTQPSLFFFFLQIRNYNMQNMKYHKLLWNLSMSDKAANLRNFWVTILLRCFCLCVCVCVYHNIIVSERTVNLSKLFLTKVTSHCIE